ncbi:MAG: DUF2125 domain-containing protein [Xanthobacteraceae bacterium]|nr:DUF2125 domain-containing protein [Xanthobacteraceae bacterium]
MIPRPDAECPFAPAPGRGRSWKIVLPLLLVIVLGVAWTVFWYYAAGTAERLIADWRARQAQAGRVVTCGEQTIGGFPFRIEVRCADARVELTGGSAPPVALRLRDMAVLAQVYDPRLLIAEFTGPLEVGEPGRPAHMVATWATARSSVRGRPAAPERLSLAIDGLKVDWVQDAQPVARADHVELHARQAPAVAGDEPAFDIVLRLAAALAPQAGPLGARPTDADVTAVLYGLKTLAPKPMAVRLREWQAAGGRLEVKSARVRQGESVSAAAGTLALTARGGLDGALQLTAAGLEHLLPALGLDRLAGPMALLGNLGRRPPGAGEAREANAGLLSLLGPRGEIDGRPAFTVPLRFSDGAVTLGPVPVGRVPPLF